MADIPIRLSWLFGAILLILFNLAGATLSRADALDMPTDIGAPSNNSMIKTPDRGMTMEQVTEEFGKPSSVLQPVGDPPITRWIYPEFTVHFENQYVIHAVIKKHNQH